MTLIQRAAKRVLSDIEPFSRYVIQRPLRNYQLEPARAILESVLHGHGETFVVLMSRQAGKNELSAQLEAYLLNLYQRAGGQIVKASPTYKPQTVNSLQRLQDRLNNPWNAGGWRAVQSYQLHLGKARCLFFSANPDANVVGATASILLEGDEGQDIAPTKWSKDFLPMASSTNATRVLWGTAWTSRTLLAQTMAELRRRESRDGKRRVFAVDWQEVAKEVPAYGVYVRGEIERLGENHPLVRTQYRLQTIDDGGGLFTAHRQSLMHGVHLRRREPEPGRTYALLVDVAGEEEGAPADGIERAENVRRDATALTVVEVDQAGSKPVYRVVDRHSWIGVRHVELYGRLCGLIRHWGAWRIVVDATGVGAGLASFLAAEFGGAVVPVQFTTKVKTDIGWGFVAIVETGRYQDYANDEEADTRQFWHEVGACEYESVSADRLRWGVWGTPRYDGLVAEGHDDLLLSAALVAVLDAGALGAGESEVIAPFDPLERSSY